MSAPVAEAAVLETIEQVLRKELAYTGALGPESDLAADLELDSVSLLTLVVELENRFRVALREEDAGAVRTVGELAQLVVRRAGEAAAAEPG